MSVSGGDELVLLKKLDTLSLFQQGNVFLLRLSNGENRFNPDTIGEWNAALDEVERVHALNPNKGASLVTVGEDRYYSNGLDLAWMAASPKSTHSAFIHSVHKLLGRMMTFPMITVAAMNGHAFAGGAMIALCHDYRVMRSDRGFFCLPEIDIHIPLSAPMTAVIAAKVVDSSVYRDIVFTGMRVTAEEAVKMRLVDQAAPEAEVLPVALEIAGRLESKARDHKTLKELKLGRFGDVLDLCNTAMEFSLPSQRSATGPPRAKL